MPSDLSSEADVTESILPPPAIGYLIDDYGRYLGIEGLALDEEYSLTLEVEGTDITLTYAGGSAGFLMEIVLGAADETEADVYKTVCLTNHVVHRVGGGFASLDPVTGLLVWNDHLRVENLTVEWLDEAVKAAVKHAATWTTAMNLLSEEEPPAQADAKTLPTESFLRI